MSLVDQNLARRIRRLPEPDITGVWPADRLACLRDAGVFQWGLPIELGGRSVTSGEMLEGYLDLAQHCLTSAFILTQRDAACHRIANSENWALRQKLLPDHCSGRCLATVGISHLSTSRQHWKRPSVVAARTSTGFELTGEAPWVTSAPHADLLVTGATLEDDQQILVALPTSRTGVRIGASLKLLALTASCTGSVIFDHVDVHADEILAGPVRQVMKVGATGGTGSLTTTTVALGAVARTLEGLRQEAAARSDLEDGVNDLTLEWQSLKCDVLTAAQMTGDLRATAESLRFRANSLATRAAQAYVCCAKGAGFVSGHPAERSLREAMFFHVWSSPPAVTSETLRVLMNNQITP